MTQSDEMVTVSLNCKQFYTAHLARIVINNPAHAWIPATTQELSHQNQCQFCHIGYGTTSPDTNHVNWEFEPWTSFHHFHHLAKKDWREVPPAQDWAEQLMNGPVDFLTIATARLLLFTHCAQPYPWRHQQLIQLLHHPSFDVRDSVVRYLAEATFYRPAWQELGLRHVQDLADSNPLQHQGAYDWIVEYYHNNPPMLPDLP